MEKSSIFIGEIIKKVLSERQITKAELARRLNVKPQSVDYLLTRKSIDTDTLYNVSLALDYDFALLYSIKKEQTNSDKTPDDYKLANAKVTVEIELNQEDMAKLDLRKKIISMLSSHKSNR